MSSGRIDPLDDVEVIETELLVADLESLERRVPSLVKKAKGGDREAKDILPLMERVLAGLREGHPARETEVSDDERKAFRGLQLLTSKPLLYVCNVEEDAAATGNALSAAVAARAAETGAETAVISARIEAEVAELEDPAEREAYLESLGLEETGLAKVIHAGYRLLDQITFFTAGPKESRAPGRSGAAPRPRKRPAPSTPTSSAASSAPRPSPTTTSSPSAASRRRRKPAACAPRAATTRSRTATSSCSASTSDPRPPSPATEKA